MSIKTDCFAWNRKSIQCKALRELVCLHGECSFYKPKKDVPDYNPKDFDDDENRKEN